VKNGQREGVFGIFGLNNSVQGSIVPLLPRLFKKTRRAAASNDHGRLFEASSTVVNFNFFSNNFIMLIQQKLTFMLLFLNVN
jgi:predicted membrane-bound mannosyltransferase